MRISWILLVHVLSLSLAGCAASPTPASEEVAPSAAPAVTTSTAAATTEWQTYSNAQAGYSAKYPADWTINESVGTNNESITTFMSPDNEQGLSVSVLQGETTVEEIPDMPNTRCQLVTISGLPGQRCLDTVALSISTTFSEDGKQFAIVAIGKHPDQNIYQRFSESFTVTH